MLNLYIALTGDHFAYAGINPYTLNAALRVLLLLHNGLSLVKAESAVERLSSVFHRFDADNDGSISAAELQNGAKQEWRLKFKAHDKNNDGQLDEAEMLSMLRSTADLASMELEDQLHHLKARDTNNDGRLDEGELEEFYSRDFEDYQRHHLENLMLLSDANSDKQLSKEEFLQGGFHQEL